MWSDIKGFWSKPFSEDMSVPGWFMFLGLLMVLTILWNLTLRHVFME